MLSDPKEEIKNRLDIVEVISDYIQLQKAGTNYKACCPFHNEKTPSFIVSPQRQVWHCFGCSKHGDIFTFIMNFENVDFITSLKILADKAGVILPKYDKNLNSQDKSSYEVMDLSMNFFHQNLIKNQEALQYLNDRHLDIDVIKEFKIGFANDDWRHLIEYLIAKNYKIKDIFETGLIIQKADSINNSNAHLNASNYYDRFRSRIMFPIFNTSGQIVGYTARIFKGKLPLKTIKNIDETGKYINSPQTKIYEKSKILYGFNITKKYISQKNEAIIVEGTTDFLSGYIKGHNNIVASLGTALTIDQLNLLKRLTDNLILAYDNDEAGKIATERNIKLALNLGFNIKILDLKDSKDLSDFINEKNNNLEKEINNALPVMDFFINRAKALFNISIIDGKHAFLNYFLKKLKWEKDLIKISFYLNKISTLTDIKLDVIENVFKKTEPEEIDDFSINKIIEKEETKEKINIKNRQEILSETILTMFVQKPTLLKKIIIDNKEFFSKNYESILDLIEKQGIDIINEKILDPFIKEQLDLLFVFGSKNINVLPNDQMFINEAESFIELLKEEYFKSKINYFKNEIKNAETTNQHELIPELLKELNMVCERLNQIKQN